MTKVARELAIGGWKFNLSNGILGFVFWCFHSLILYADTYDDDLSDRFAWLGLAGGFCALFFCFSLLVAIGHLVALLAALAFFLLYVFMYLLFLKWEPFVKEDELEREE